MYPSKLPFNGTGVPKPQDEKKKEEEKAPWPPEEGSSVKS